MNDIEVTVRNGLETLFSVGPLTNGKIQIVGSLWRPTPDAGGNPEQEVKICASCQLKEENTCTGAGWRPNEETCMVGTVTLPTDLSRDELTQKLNKSSCFEIIPQT